MYIYIYKEIHVTLMKKGGGRGTTPPPSTMGVGGNFEAGPQWIYVQNGIFWQFNLKFNKCFKKIPWACY